MEKKQTKEWRREWTKRRGIERKKQWRKEQIKEWRKEWVKKWRIK